MFKYHGFSGPCPTTKTPSRKNARAQVHELLATIADLQARIGEKEKELQLERDDNELHEAALEEELAENKELRLRLSTPPRKPVEREDIVDLLNKLVRENGNSWPSTWIIANAMLGMLEGR